MSKPEKLSEEDLRAITDAEMRQAVGLSADDVLRAAKEWLSYSQETGVFVWAKRKPRIHVGMKAGHNNGKGYRVIELCGKPVMAHRLAWLWCYGEWPSKEIDHINGVRDDNRIANLRVVSHAENCQNKRRARVDCQSGIQGASKRKHGYVAEIVTHGNRKYLGTFKTASEAGAAYQAAKMAFHIEGAAA